MSDLVSQRERGKDRLNPPTRAQKLGRRGHGGNNDRAIMLAEHGTDGRQFAAIDNRCRCGVPLTWPAAFALKD